MSAFQHDVSSQHASMLVFQHFSMAALQQCSFGSSIPAFQHSYFPVLVSSIPAVFHLSSFSSQAFQQFTILAFQHYSIKQSIILSKACQHNSITPLQCPQSTIHLYLMLLTNLLLSTQYPYELCTFASLLNHTLEENENTLTLYGSNNYLPTFSTLGDPQLLLTLPAIPSLLPWNPWENKRKECVIRSCLGDHQGSVDVSSGLITRFA